MILLKFSDFAPNSTDHILYYQNSPPLVFACYILVVSSKSLDLASRNVNYLGSDSIPSLVGCGDVESLVRGFAHHKQGA